MKTVLLLSLAYVFTMSVRADITYGYSYNEYRSSYTKTSYTITYRPEYIYRNGVRYVRYIPVYVLTRYQPPYGCRPYYPPHFVPYNPPRYYSPVRGSANN